MVRAALKWVTTCIIHANLLLHRKFYIFNNMICNDRKSCGFSIAQIIHKTVVNNLRRTLRKILKYGFLLFGVIILIGFALKGNITHEQFDSEKWKNWTESEEELSLRWDMMNSLRNNHELDGKTKTEIINLLGKPDSETNSDFRYYLGMSKRGINTGSLTIMFSKKGKVIDFSVWQG